MWSKPPNEIILKQNEAHIWNANLDSDDSLGKNFLTYLSEDESKRADRFRFSKDRQRFIVARGILRLFLGKYLNEKPQNIVFEYSDYDKPSVKNSLDLKFNISHSKKFALFAFTLKKEIGVDLEYINRKVEVEPIAKRFFAKNEYQKLMALPKKNRLQAFFYCWTRKEAFIKAIGEGFSFPLDKFEVSLESTNDAGLIANYVNPKDVSNWTISVFSVTEDFVGTLATKGEISEIKFWEWTKTSITKP